MYCKGDASVSNRRRCNIVESAMASTSSHPDKSPTRAPVKKRVRFCIPDKPQPHSKQNLVSLLGAERFKRQKCKRRIIELEEGLDQSRKNCVFFEKEIIRLRTKINRDNLNGGDKSGDSKKAHSIKKPKSCACRPDEEGECDQCDPFKHIRRRHRKFAKLLSLR